MKIKNWAEFQHFKDRTPPWIKLYRYLLDDPEWHALSGDDAKHLVMLWLIASEDKDMEGTLPEVKKIAFRLRITEKQTNQLLINLSNWLILDDINMISIGYQDDTPEERRGETEKRHNKKIETLISDNFVISERVYEWANKNSFNQLEKHCDYFVNICKAKGYKYVDWDAAFMRAIRDNWAKVSSSKLQVVI